MDKSLLNSKKAKMAFLGALSAAIMEFVIVFCKGMGIEIPQELVLMILAPFLAYITGKSAADIAYNAKNGRAVETLSLGGTFTPATPVAPALNIAPIVNTEYDYYGGMSNAKTKYQKMLWDDATLTNLSDPAQVESDYIGYFSNVVSLAEALYKTIRGIDPLVDIEDSCRSGDWSFEARAVLHSRRDLNAEIAWVNSVKRDRALSWQRAGLGYFINGVPTPNIPAWAMKFALEHTPEGKAKRQEIPPDLI